VSDVLTSTADDAPTGAVKFIESRRPRWTDFLLVAMAIGLLLAGGLIERISAVLLVLWPLARTLRNRYATMLRPAGVSVKAWDREFHATWDEIDRLIAVEGLTTRHVRLTRWEGRPVTLSTPMAMRLARPDGFAGAMAELRRWVAAYGGGLQVETLRTHSTREAVAFQVVVRGIQLGVIAFDLAQRRDGHPLNDNLALVLMVGALVVVPGLLFQIAGGRRREARAAPSA
jgi:hypothetical protein